MRPLFIASLGNPGAEYAHTLHSAGHTLLAALASHTQSSPLAVSRTLTGTKGRCSTSPTYAVQFWESPSYMNDSGGDVAVAWRRFGGGTGGADRGSGSDDGDSEPAMVIIHDELELPLGRFSVKTGTGMSARGHNGLKSVLHAGKMRTTRFTRIGVGIGPRPVSREPDVVARFVLRKMSSAERKTVEGLAGDVWREIERVREGGVSQGGGKQKAGKAV